MDKQMNQIEKNRSPQRRKRNPYNKIPLKAKLIFFRKVIHQNGNFRQIAKNLGLKYSTAKTLVRNYKGAPQQQNQELMTRICESFDHIKQTKKRCTYQCINAQNSSQLSPTIPFGMQQNAKFQYIHRIQIVCNNIKIQNS